MTDKARMDWLETQCYAHNIMVSRHRVRGTFRMSAVVGVSKGVRGVRAAIDRAIVREQKKKEGAKK